MIPGHSRFLCRSIRSPNILSHSSSSPRSRHVRLSSSTSTTSSTSPTSSPISPSITPSATRSLSIALPPPEVSSKPPDPPDPPASENKSFTLPPGPPPAAAPSIPHSDLMISSSPPFHTHSFFLVLERTFPTPVARTLMRATRGLLADRIGRVRREALTVKDLDNQAYLFRAALSEIRAESTMSTQSENAKLETQTSALRREVDALDGKMKEDIQTLKHEIQMELDSRKNEARTDLKSQDIKVEELVNKNTVTLGDLRTEIEKIKWDNMRQAVVFLGMFAIFIVMGMEITGFFSRGKKTPPSPPAIQPKYPGNGGDYPSVEGGTHSESL